MKAVEQNSDDLNEIAEAYLTTPGDARDAWQVIGTCLSDGRVLPDWVQGYLLRVARDVAQLDGLDGVAAAFGFHPESIDVQTRPPKAYYDSLTVFSVIAGWRRKALNAGQKLSLADCFARYVSEHLTDRENEETVKTAYYRGKAIAEDEIGLVRAIGKHGWPLHKIVPDDT
jgi:hypothetical protein